MILEGRELAGMLFLFYKVCHIWYPSKQSQKTETNSPKCKQKLEKYDVWFQPRKTHKEFVLSPCALRLANQPLMSLATHRLSRAQTRNNRQHFFWA